MSHEDKKRRKPRLYAGKGVEYGVGAKQVCVAERGKEASAEKK